jgi:hypothetical protein
VCCIELFFEIPSSQFTIYSSFAFLSSLFDLALLIAAATGSYIALLPSSLSSSSPRLYQAGGPVAQTFSLSSSTGGIDEQLQELIYLDGGETELWDDKTDRTRVALRYGSHAVDIDPVFGRAYVPHVCVASPFSSPPSPESSFID